MAASDTSGKKAAGRAFAALAIFIGLTALLFFYNPSGFYPWAKAIHVIAMIAWMAGMLYLPRLFVYHADAAPGSETSETFKIMEGRLLRLIINPAHDVLWCSVRKHQLTLHVSRHNTLALRNGLNGRQNLNHGPRLRYGVPSCLLNYLST